MAKVYKSEKKSGFKKKKDSGERKEKTGDADFKRKDFDDSKKSYSGKSDKKPVFKRYRDESKPSDFGSGKKENSFRNDDFRKKKSFDDKPTFKKKFDGDDKKRPFRREDSDDKPRTFEKKIFDRERRDDKPRSFSKPRPAANPNDLDESDFEYGKPKPTYDSDRGRDFKKKPYEKKPYIKKTYSTNKPNVSKPAREEEDGKVRLNKYIANAGICSRREADVLIQTGSVSVNGTMITELGYRIKPTDMVSYGGQTIKREKLVYIVINKPKNFITTSDDPYDRETVLSLIKDACKERVYPVGRLDRNTTGVLIITNDGEMTKKLTHPRYEKKKIYHVVLDKTVTGVDIKQIKEGLELEDGLIQVDEVSYVSGADKKEVGIELHSGKNRIVRRIFEHLGYDVKKLDRVSFAGLTKKDLPRGRWRFLTQQEIDFLKMS